MKMNLAKATLALAAACWIAGCSQPTRQGDGLGPCDVATVTVYLAPVPGDLAYTQVAGYRGQAIVPDEEQHALVLAWPLAPANLPPKAPGHAYQVGGGEGAGHVTVTFATGQWQVSPAAARALEGFLSGLDPARLARIEVDGHADSTGSDRYNLSLSQRRAEAVKGFLVHKGVPRHKVLARGHGESMPVADNSGRLGRLMNRRAEAHAVDGD